MLFNQAEEDNSNMNRMATKTANLQKSGIGLQVNLELAIALPRHPK
ncbi:hypothetical protein FDUTEX481_01058 [Tolypothrix sp. PCC 7601]|nr:hypothetical protein FDUTEX481_01058 [Tolypothrix sp. PCC 7601]